MKTLEKDYQLDLNSKVILLFDNYKINFPNEETIEWYINQMEEGIDERKCVYSWFCMKWCNELWEVKVLAGVITSYLTYQFEYDDLFYTIKDNTIYVDRLKIEEKVR